MHRYRTYLIAASLVLLIAAASGAVVGLFEERTAETSVPQTQEDKGDTAAVPEPEEERIPSRYVEVVEGCGPYFEGACVNVRSGPGTSYPVVTKLRQGVVLKVDKTVKGDEQGDGHIWHHVVFDEWVRYPDRVAKEWYIASDLVRPFEDESAGESRDRNFPDSPKYILIDRTIQRLFAWDGETLFMELPISTGLDLTPTPRGVFHVYKKTPTRYMQGPLPGISDQYYDLPGVPWNLYFTNEGGAIHGAYWHDKFGQPWSHGCVNLPLDKARALYYWTELGTRVIVRD